MNRLHSAKVASWAGPAVISASSRISIGALISLLLLVAGAHAQRPGTGTAVVQSKQELVTAIGSNSITETVAASDLNDLEGIRLLPGQTLRSEWASRGKRPEDPVRGCERRVGAPEGIRSVRPARGLHSVESPAE